MTIQQRINQWNKMCSAYVAKLITEQQLNQKQAELWGMF